MAAPKKTKEKKSDKDTAPAKDAEKKASKKKSKKSKDKATEATEPVDISYMRLQADFDNYRKRVLREKNELYSRANEDIMEELLSVMDHLDLALNAVGVDHDDPVVKGFELVGGQLATTLKKFGLSVIESEGHEFDPNLHEAIMHMPSDDVEEDFIVSDARKGYKLGERLLRASQVVVSSGAPEEEIEDAPTEENDD